MGVAFFIVLDKKDPGFDTMVNGKSLAQDAERLEQLAQSLGFPALEEFVSYSPDEARAMMEDLGTDPEQIAEMELPDQVWHDAEEGLNWVTAVIARIQAQPSLVNNAKSVLSDLQEYENVLQQAQAIGARWNLQVDF